MFIDRIRIYPISLPFALSFDHSLSRGTAAANVLVEIIADNGRIRGYGEGAPRGYVTGETQRSAVAALAGFARHPSFPWQLSEMPAATAALADIGASTAAHAALCALDTALFDLMGKATGTATIDFFSRGHRVPEVCYGAPIPLTDAKRTIRLCELSLAMGIHTLKLKLGPDPETNRRAMAAVHSVFENNCTLKVDVNGIWETPTARAHLRLFEKHRVRVVEQPLPPYHPDTTAYAGELRALGIKCMADESACSQADIRRILAEGSFDMINVRISKCGGFIKTFALIDRIRKSGLSYQVGCHLGESGLLSAAGRCLSLLSGDALFFDGSYDAFLLAENITTRHVTFQQGGTGRELGGFGLGVDVDARQILRLSDAKGAVTVNRPFGMTKDE